MTDPRQNEPFSVDPELLSPPESDPYAVEDGAPGAEGPARAAAGVADAQERESAAEGAAPADEAADSAASIPAVPIPAGSAAEGPDGADEDRSEEDPEDGAAGAEAPDEEAPAAEGAEGERLDAPEAGGQDADEPGAEHDADAEDPGTADEAAAEPEPEAGSEADGEAGTEPDPEDVLEPEPSTSSTESAAQVTSLGGSTMARRVRRARRGQRAQARRRNVVGALTHTVGALSAVGILTVSTWALGWMPLPEHRAEAVQVDVAPAAGLQQRVCPGAVQQLGLADTADEAVPVGSPERTIAVEPGSAETVELGGEDTSPVTVEAPGEVDGESAIVSGSQSVSLSTDDTAGFAASNCVQPAANQWLLGGATTIGHTLVLDVVNPGNADARVNFQIFDVYGQVQPGVAEAVVPPGERQQVTLAGVTPDSDAFAVRVTSTGSSVAAFLHETITDTLDPKGVEVIGPTALPATTQVLPGVFVYGRPDPSPTAPTDIGTTLRILNPGDAEATATLTAYEEDGTAHSQELELAPGRIIELPYADVPEGEYTIVLESSAPVLLAGRVAPLDGAEFGWVPASPELVSEELVPVPEGPNPRLSLYNPGDEPREIEIDGAAVTIEPHGTYTEDVDAGGTVPLSNVDGLSGTIHYSGTAQLSSIPVLPGNADAEPIGVVR
ncbi:DUF5719 family protein [Gulosibacter sp. 10]|uniref:DUF5719 family protein n=1 Tax=Gulosibacter sp. 10 TaxID=1255570 RepID=UPI00097F6813|nr:DUF5719 family protein [Gulosibacter sp. 10]SJM58899.1 Putative secreted protein [Gulosibacter sp. 10]